METFIVDSFFFVFEFSVLNSMVTGDMQMLGWRKGIGSHGIIDIKATVYWYLEASMIPPPSLLHL